VLEAILWILNTDAQWHMLLKAILQNGASAVPKLVPR
jgi:hypothetical protein